jgi:UDP-N-acetylglucosamine 2-epimerase (non-hydrolysing)
VKVAPLWKALAEHPRLEPVLISTGQHRDMLREVHAWFGMRPAADLSVMTADQGLPGLTARVMTALSAALDHRRPAAVVVHGDTTTSMVAALACRYAGIPLVHLEAGLRTHDLLSPFPEELNRRLTGVMADLHLAPTDRARANLLAEGADPDLVVVTGNTVVDALLDTARRAHPIEDEQVRRTIAAADRLVVATLHRRESHGAPLRRVARALVDLTRHRPGLRVVLPLHPNPRVRASIGEVVEGCAAITVCAPLPYPQFVSLLDAADLVVTDSGGIQEEAPSLDKPVLVVRETTERPEAVEAGTARVVGTDPSRILGEALGLLDDAAAYRAMAGLANPFGDGHAGRRGAAAIARLLGVATAEDRAVPRLGQPVPAAAGAAR